MGDEKTSPNAFTGKFVVTPSAKQRDNVFLGPSSFLRSLACLGIVVVHMVWFLALAAEDKHAFDGALAQHTWFTVIFNPEPPMQTFFCLTGFFAALSLVPALETTHSYAQTVLRYYQKRLKRIVPAFYLVLLIARLVVFFLGRSVDSLPPDVRRGFFGTLFSQFHPPSCENQLLHTALFAHNQVLGGGCYKTTWSLACQMQFWLLFPLALVALQPQKAGFRKRLALSLMGMIGVVLAYRAWQVYTLELWSKVPLQAFAPPNAETLGVVMFLARHEYNGTLVRIGPMCFGALAALIVTTPAWTQAVLRHSKRLHALWIGLVLSNFIGCFVNKMGGYPDPAHILSNPISMSFAYVFITGVLSPMLPTMALILTTTKQLGQSSLVARFFALPIFSWLADITYDIFLTHPLVFLCIWYLLPPTLWFSPSKPLNFALVTCLAIAISIPVAWLHNRAWAAFMRSLKPKFDGHVTAVKQA